MESDKNKPFISTQKVGGYSLANLLSNNTFIMKKSDKPRLSFKLNNIVEIDGSEIMKIELYNGLIARIMKFNTEDGTPAITFDIVNDETKEIVLNSDKDYVGGIGLAELFMKSDLITQWEIPILTKLCRSFLLGDIDTFKVLIKTYNLRITKDTEWYLKNELGLDI